MARTALVGMSTQASRERAAEDARRVTEATIAEDAENREDFATSGLPPDWLQTGLAGAGAGFVFGPVGGAIGLAVSAIVNQSRRNGIAQQAIADAATATKLIEGGDATLKLLESAAVTDQDKLEVAILRKDYEQAVTMAQNPDPQVAGQGFQALQSIPGLVSGEADEIEAAGIARDKLAREQHQQFVTNADDIRGDNIRESASYITTVDAFQRMAELQKQGTTVADTSLIYALANLNDPGAIVTDGDISALAATGAISEQALALYQQTLLGKGKLTETQRAELYETGKAIMRTQLEAQSVRNNGAAERARLAELPVDFQRTVVVPINERLREMVVPGAIPAEGEGRESIKTTPTGEERTTSGEQPGFVARGLSGLAMAGGEIVEDVARVASGHKVEMDRTTGDRYVVDQDGGIVEQLEPASEFENQSGDTIQRVETENGPTYRNVSQSEQFEADNIEAERARRRAEVVGGRTTLRPINE